MEKQVVLQANEYTAPIHTQRLELLALLSQRLF